MKNKKVFCTIALVCVLFTFIITISYTFKFDKITNIFKSTDGTPTEELEKKKTNINSYRYKTGIIPPEYLPKHQQIANLCEDCYRPFQNVKLDDDFPGCKKCQVTIFNSPP